MDCDQRFPSYDSTSYEASVAWPRPDAGLNRKKRRSTTGAQGINLDELYEWSRKQAKLQPLDTSVKEVYAESEWSPRPPSQGADAGTKDEWATESTPKRKAAGADSAPQLPSSFLHSSASARPYAGSEGGAQGAQQAGGGGSGGGGGGGGEDEKKTPKLGLRRQATVRMNAVMDLDEDSRFGWWTGMLLVLTTLVVMLTALYANGSVKALMQDKFFTTTASNAILILRILTEASALLLAALVVKVVEDLQWALAARPQGVSLLHFVGLDTGTGVWGLVRLLATAEWSDKYSSLFRLLVICSIPLPGVILMGAINLELVFFPQHTYPVAAGIDTFNSSYITNVDDNILTALLISMGSPYWAAKDSWTLDPLGPSYGGCTVSANDSSWAPCAESHILTGGVLAITPQTDNLSTFPDATAYVVPRTRTMQLEYGDVHDLDALYRHGACYTVGSAHAAAYWCTDTGPKKELLFGSSYCPIALQSTGQCLNDTSWNSPLQIASSMFTYKRYATVNYDRSNFSILSLTDLSPPEREVIKLHDYMTALSAVVPGFRPNNNNPAIASPPPRKGDNSALATYAVSALPINDNQIARAMSRRAMRKAMGAPFTFFHANYFSRERNPFELARPRAGLSPDLYTTLSLAIASHQAVAGRRSLLAFGLLCAALLAVCAALVLATARICDVRPPRCGYPTLDFAAVCMARGGLPRYVGTAQEECPPGGGGGRHAGGQHGMHGLHRSLTELGEKRPGPFQVASRIKGEKVILG